MRINSLIKWVVFLAIGIAIHAQAAQPNIIFIFTDDMGYGDLGVLFQNDRVPGLPRQVTPNLDRMGTGGIQLRTHYCAAPVCAPSRGSLLTGTHQGHCTIRNSQFGKAVEDNHTFASVLKEAGYYTAMFGKHGNEGDGDSAATWTAYPTKRGFDYYFGYVTHGDGHNHYPKHQTPHCGRGPKDLWENDFEISADLDKCYTTDLFTARAKKTIIDQTNDHPDQPFFIYLAYDTPHAALQIPTQAYPTGTGLTGGIQWIGTPGNMINTASGTVDSYYHPDYAAATYDDDDNPGTPEVAWPKINQRYAGSVRRIDDCIGDLLDTLEDLGIATNTLVVFSNDNGPHNVDYLDNLGPEYYTNHSPTFLDNFGPFDGIKRNLWEGGIRMPTLAYWPETIPTNQISYEPSANYDWLPTFVDAAGLVPPSKTDGVSLLPTLTNSGEQRESTIYIEYDAANTPTYAEFEADHKGYGGQAQVIHMDGYKGVRVSISSHATDFRIYDSVSNDVKEVTNLAGTSPYFDTLQQRMKDRVLQVRRINTSAARPYDNEYVPATTLATTFTNSTVEYATFEGGWPWLPDFLAMTSGTTGTVTGLDLSIRPIADDYGVLFTGYLDIPVDGSYMFYLTSDSGANLRIHDALVIDDDFHHDGGEVSGSILLAAGKHPFRLSYRHTTGAETLTLKYSSSSITKQEIPLSTFAFPGTPGPIIVQASDDSGETLMDTAVLIDVLANDTPSDEMVLESVDTPAAGAASIDSGKILYTPNSGFLGSDTFSYTAAYSGETSTASVDVDVYYKDGLIWFPFNQTYGIETVSAGGAYTASLSGFSDPANPWVAGKHNRALSLNGIDQFATIDGFNGILGAAPRTQMAWVRTENSLSTRSVVAWADTASGGRKWHFLINASGQVRQEVAGGAIVGTAIVNDGNWHHVALSFSGGTLGNANIYVDGQPDPLSVTSAKVVDTINSGLATIGLDGQDRYFDGDIDELRIYDRALTGPEILAIYNETTSQAAMAWARRYLGDATVDWGADDDGDGGELLLEYALGGQPGISDIQTMEIQSEIMTDRLHIRYPQRIEGTHDLLYAVKVSYDLETWTPLTADQITITSHSDPGFEKIDFELDPPFGGDTKFFVRLSITLP